MRTPKTALILTGAALVALLTGCSGGGDGGGPTPTVTETVTAAPTEDATPTPTNSPADLPASTPTPTPTCGPASGAEAAAAGIAALPQPAGLEDFRWDAANADYSGYDPCADLSWSVVTVDGGTAGSPYAILLFHDGRYLGTATSVQYAFQPAVERTTDTSIRVTYTYPKGNEANADASGRAIATYTWNADAQRVDMTGDTPPAQ